MGLFKILIVHEHQLLEFLSDSGLFLIFVISLRLATTRLSKKNKLIDEMETASLLLVESLYIRPKKQLK